MRLLYFSVHAILEFDEIRLFRSLGYTVFPLGSYFGGAPSQAFRPQLDFGEDFDVLMKEWHRLGGRYSHEYTASFIPQEFVDLFDVCIVMHEPSFLLHYWETLSVKPVVWRTIGVDINGTDAKLRTLRDRGLYVVRYSPVEKAGENYIGDDAIIRFSKRVSDYRPWSGKGMYTLTFANNFAERHPTEFDLYKSATAGLDVVLGGSGNESVPGSAGLVNYADQLDLLEECACYFYASGTFITYTLNFIEAWLSGAPVVAVNCHMVYPKEVCRFAEVPLLIDHERDGFIVNDVVSARKTLDKLITEPDLARNIGIAGSQKARALFDEAANAPLWKKFIENIVD